ncbi:protein of unknown function [Cupriavidus neocaledonicus]|uniref:Uncharacterized protein n=1 Tax=Cupriavidus neocaledonicus TaxID=1040979 RepID=A0A375H4B8_9BURK|nr:hypothetical protein CBM2605_A170047 [Cupriavidus neocaledonicus]SPD47074.1 protein of unknown function [Cupriavidus neocaledonicus]
MAENLVLTVTRGRVVASPLRWPLLRHPMSCVLYKSVENATALQQARDRCHTKIYFT